MNWRRLILTVGTKLPIAMVGRQIILMMGDVLAPTTLRRDPPRLIGQSDLAAMTGIGRESASRIRRALGYAEESRYGPSSLFFR
jgi:hypothetical protein